MVSREKILESLLDLTGRTSARTRDELLEQVLRCALTLAQSDGAAAVISRGKRLQRFSLSRAALTPTVDTPMRLGVEGSRPMLLDGHPVVIPDLARAGRLGPEDDCPGVNAGPALFVPLRLREHQPGYLAVFRQRGAEVYSQEDVRLVTLLAAWAAIAIENIRLSESVEKLAVTDDLTQVYNFRFLKSALRREIKRAGRYRQDLGLIMVDVDNLKTYNDQHGHLRGSFLLREMAALFAAQVRTWDLVAKYGGDEFTVILPQTDGPGALIAAERLRLAVEAHAFPLARPGEITVSLGVAAFPNDGLTGSTLLDAADRALYQAKRQGRNRVGRSQRLAA
jgi:diguanylate cyclase (GGDEF)-like protein